MKSENKKASPEDGHGLVMSRRTFLGGAAGSAGIRLLSPLAALGAGGSALISPETADAANLAGYDWAQLFDDNVARNSCSSLITDSYWGNDSVPGPTVNIQAGAAGHIVESDNVKDGTSNNLPVKFRNANNLGESEQKRWFAFAGYQKQWLCRLNDGDAYHIYWPRVGTYYGEPVGVRLWLQGGASSGRYNEKTGATYSKLAGYLDNAFGCHQFAIIPKRFQCGWWLYGVKSAKFTMQFYYTGDDGMLPVSVDRAFLQSSNLVADGGGVEFVGVSTGFDGWYVLQASGLKLQRGTPFNTLPWEKCQYVNSDIRAGNYMCIGGTQPSAGFSEPANTVISAFKGSEFVLYTGDTAGQVLFDMKWDPGDKRVAAKFYKRLWNGIGSGAPAVPNGVYRIFLWDGSSRRYLGHAHAANMTQLRLESFAKGAADSQTWVVASHDGYTAIAPVNNLLLAMNDYGGKAAAGDRVLLYTRDWTSAMKWFPVKAGAAAKASDGKTDLVGFTLRPTKASAAVCAALSGGFYDESAEIKLAKVGDKDRKQVWYFEPVDASGNSMAAEVATWVSEGGAPPSPSLGDFKYAADDLTAGGSLNGAWGQGSDLAVKLGHLVGIKESAAPSTWRKDGRTYGICQAGRGAGSFDLVDYPRKFKMRLVKLASKSSGVKIPNGVYKIRNGKSLYLDIPGNKGDIRGHSVGLAAWGSGTDDLWTVWNSPEGYICLAPVSMGGYQVHSASGDPAKAGDKLNTWPWGSGAANAKFIPLAQADGSFVLQSNKTKDLCIGVAGGDSAKAGAAVQLVKRGSTPAAHAKWYFEPANGKGFKDYVSRLPEALPSSSLKGTRYTVYSDAACTKKVKDLEISSDKKPTDQGVEVGWFSGWCGVQYYLKETSCAPGYQTSSVVYGLERPVNEGYNGYPTGGLDVVLVDVPNEQVTVHFLLVDKDDKATEKHSFKVAAGTTLSTSDKNFKTAEGYLKAFYGVEDDRYVERWYEGAAGRLPDWKAAFAPRKVSADVYLYAECPTGTVAYYCDGTDASHVVSVGGKKAVYTKIYLGTRYAVPSAVAAAARRAGCTPGWDGWFADPADKAFTEDEPGRGGASRAQASFVLSKPETNLYSVNRATVGFAYVEGSARPEDLAGGCHVEPDQASALADVGMPAPAVHRVDVTRPLPSRSVAYAAQGDGRWRTYSPAFWYADEAGAGATATSIRMSADAERYIDWEALTRDGVVDRRA